MLSALDIQIRKAKASEYTEITPYILLAMEEIVYQFIGEDSPEKAQLFLETLIREKGNQYSYENCWVVVSGNEILGAAIVYDGGQLEALRKPVAKKIKDLFGRDFTAENETQAGEFYIDCVGVSPRLQGKGIGSRIFRHLIEEYVHQNKGTLGLLVDQTNPQAKKLYLKLGFEVVGKKTLVGRELEHLQFRT